MKKITVLSLILTLILTLSACSGTWLAASSKVAYAAQSTGSGVEETGTTVNDLAVAYSPVEVEYDSDDLDSASEDVDTIIRLNGDSISVDGDGVTVDDTIVTITSAGTYSINGTLNDGQIIVNTEDQEKVKLVLNGVNIASSTSAPIYVLNAEKTVITLADGTENFVTDGDSYLFEDAAEDEPNAAIFSHDDLTINGDGSLTVEANYNHGIVSKDDLKITGGNITITAVNDGLKGKDSVTIKDGALTITAGGDGLQSQNDSDAEKGTIAIEGGTLNITAGLDGIQAETSVLVSGGEANITTGGGSDNSSILTGWGLWGNNDDTDSDSAKGLKAGVDVTISGGVININSSDDAIHSNGSFTLDEGVLWLASGDDGIHADATLEINGGELTISQAYEGLESAVITLNDGTIHLTASDDGINVAGGNDGSSINGRPGQNEFAASDEYHLFINGGYVVIDAGGDGLDSNGYFDMTGGIVIVNGPTNNGNGALDYNGTFNISGGTLVAVGSSGMAQAPSTSSTQYSVIYNFASTQDTGTMVHIETADGAEILSYTPSKEYQSLVLSTPELENGETYVVYSNGSSTGIATDGLYADGTYTAGTDVTRFTISSIVTGESRGGPGGGPPSPGGDRP